jgi:uncharacterized protein (DUF2132 family)
MPSQNPEPQTLSNKSKDPLHGLTLKFIVEFLQQKYGWVELGKMINIKCFTDNPSINSSLTFLRKTDWARTKVESLYLYALRSKKRQSSDI